MQKQDVNGKLFSYALGDLTERASAVIYPTHAGQELGHGLVDIISGDRCPSGRLSMTWYASTSDLGDIMDYDIIGSGKTYQYFEGKPLYPFGHGPSYTTFAYCNMTCVRQDDRVDVGCQITNTGKVAGDEVVQLYIKKLKGMRKRPLRQLIGFEKISLEPGETKCVDFSVPFSRFKYWENGVFKSETGPYEVMIEASSEDIRLDGMLRL